jgi:hypothetical protein
LVRLVFVLIVSLRRCNAFFFGHLYRLSKW